MSLYALDIETTGLEWTEQKILCIGLFREDEGYKVFYSVEEFLKEFDPFNHKYVAHNGGFDFNFLRHHGCDLRSQFAYCTRALSRFLLPTESPAPGQTHAYSLQSLFLSHLGGHPYKVNRAELRYLPKEELISYNKKDCEVTWKLFEFLMQKMENDKLQMKRFNEWAMPLVRLDMEMEYEGIFREPNGLVRKDDFGTPFFNRLLRVLNLK